MKTLTAILFAGSLGLAGCSSQRAKEYKTCLFLSELIHKYGKYDAKTGTYRWEAYKLTDEEETRLRNKILSSYTKLEENPTR